MKLKKIRNFMQKIKIKFQNKLSEIYINKNKLINCVKKSMKDL